MHTLRVLYFFCLLGTIQSSKCTDIEDKGSLVTTACSLGKFLAENVKTRTISELTEDYFTQSLKDQLKLSGIKSMFKAKDFRDNHLYLGYMVALACIYTTFRVIKYAKKSKKRVSE